MDRAHRMQIRCVCSSDRQHAQLRASDVIRRLQDYALRLLDSIRVDRTAGSKPAGGADRGNQLRGVHDTALGVEQVLDPDLGDQGEVAIEIELDAAGAAHGEARAARGEDRYTG